MTDNVLKIVMAMFDQTSVELVDYYITVHDNEHYGFTEVKFETKAEAAQAYADFQKMMEGQE